MQFHRAAGRVGMGAQLDTTAHVKMRMTCFVAFGSLSALFLVFSLGYYWALMVVVMMSCRTVGRNQSNVLLKMPVDVTCAMMKDPVATVDGLCYEREDIIQWFPRCQQPCQLQITRGGK